MNAKHFAMIAECHSDDRPRRDGMDWNDGYQDGCRGAAEAIRRAGDGGGGCITHEERVEYERRILAVEMENERLKRGLRPFAVKAILWNGDDRKYAGDSKQVPHRLGDFRTAHKLIYGDNA